MDAPKSVMLPTAWVGAEELPVQFANTFVGVVAPGEIFLNIGTVVPPAILGATQEEREAQVRSLAYIQVKPIVRIALTFERLKELRKTIEDTITNYQTLATAVENQEQK